LTNRGIAYVYVNQSEKAIIDLNKAIQIKPEEPATYLNRAIAYYNLGKSKLACKDLKKSKKLGLTEIYGSGIIPFSLKLECAF
jgi:Tfp pilus assembly protein PilF